MKLRNKKTGEVTEANLIIDEPGIWRYADSIEELCNNYEDYKPAEPLIKDEKIRKAVRAWAKVNSIEKVIYAERPNRSLCCFTDMGEYDFAIEFVGWIPTLKDGEVYSIAELCGEEEE